MKNFVFVSDFDGTISKRDFYKIITDKYLKDEVKDLYKEWRSNKITDVDYLGYVFSHIGRNEKEILEDILTISIDPYIKEFIKKIKEKGGDFVVVSAGTNYYIDKVFQNIGIDNVDIYSNKTVFKDNGLHFVLNPKDEFYSDVYGIDKGKVVKKLRENYEKVFYAGDSTPDIAPSLLSDVVFAKSKLCNFLTERNKEFISFEGFDEILKHVEKYLKEWGI
ncbi:2,3-diketo-5-methylthio-1-phosphopentane phosphatase [Clostridium acetobutylicum]|uniref:Phosphoserine phosphatase family protein n=1 Tax=Clostridium acetobutylicum (strain ATCC 824 / DSM 792 / JCM 1419 / IAM 19013 / LMG 5710 / NBRC 13948 / NRRL B-527 / VKM B-1787 / 2291 / W) TaxID=272562 RepID=Q97IL5_CLOAB|nr:MULTISPECIES: MtnX-like HAD-IB family phosphatase [Clostridium]AAK79592.1 Phosphoserine phosphatase family protein [Clostridium acetobutylicum ATCC 824]ADZ20676.1 Phosphoserine phosphatase family protein [Clostridium acetobutylicum EA 2018]AEI31903.1 phosphoserine phosphatase family protein [Clostridium acetobutylicum DSM 1731]AWV79969.1 phosphoserine phosphatase [Clostridium acetobutylicum]MBC2394044.1 MtnX-like HAD-IB family phosphatase [Clostridium acetobutylicum]